MLQRTGAPSPSLLHKEGKEKEGKTPNKSEQTKQPHKKTLQEISSIFMVVLKLKILTRIQSNPSVIFSYQIGLVFPLKTFFSFSIFLHLNPRVTSLLKTHSPLLFSPLSLSISVFINSVKEGRVMNAL